MLKTLFIPTSLVAGLLLAGCATPLPPGAEPGPNGTMAYSVLIEASQPGARIEVEGDYVGETPLTLKIFGDTDGTFHDFGSSAYVIRAIPVTTNQYAQTRVFRTGQMLSSQDRIPQRIYFDMSQQPPVYMPYPVYVEPAPQIYFGTGYYSRPRYYHGYGHSYHGGYHGDYDSYRRPSHGHDSHHSLPLPKHPLHKKF